MSLPSDVRSSYLLHRTRYVGGRRVVTSTRRSSFVGHLIPSSAALSAIFES